LRHLSAPAKNLETLFKSGLAFDGSSVPGFMSVECGDLVLMPDPSTAFVDPFHEGNLIVLCRQVDAQTHEGNPADPRIVAERAESFLKSEMGAESLWLPEFEFFLLRKLSMVSRNLSRSTG
jgi:glutamine synthetase